MRRVYRPTAVYRFAATLVALSLALGPGLAHAEDSGDLGDAEATSEEPASGAAEAPAIPPVDVLGRPFPGPDLVREAKVRTVGGLLAVGAGAGLLASGLFVGSSVARGELAGGTRPGIGIGALFGSGIGLLSAGLPTVSVGVFTTKQLDRTIKGAEKVPRVVANEERFWKAVMGEHIGRTIAIGGGGSLLLGVVALAGVAATIDTDFYDARYWAAVAGTFGGGAGMVVLGILVEKGAREKQEAIRDEVDPYRRKLRLEEAAEPGGSPEPAGSEEEEGAAPAPGIQPVVAPPVPTLTPIPPTKARGAGLVVGLGWSVAF